MILLTFLSIILIWLHVSSLRFMIRARGKGVLAEDAAKLEESMPDLGTGGQPAGGPVMMSLGVIIVLNLAEIGYFVYCVYLFNDNIVVLGSSILVGYSIYSMARFLPKIKRFMKQPVKLLMERTEGYENVLNIIMASVEIIFCLYILYRIFFTL
jgi:hypothetical protein